MIPAIFVWSAVSLWAGFTIISLKAQNKTLKEEVKMLRDMVNRKG